MAMKYKVRGILTVPIYFETDAKDIEEAVQIGGQSFDKSSVELHKAVTNLENTFSTKIADYEPAFEVTEVSKV